MYVYMYLLLSGYIFSSDFFFLNQAHLYPISFDSPLWNPTVLGLGLGSFKATDGGTPQTMSTYSYVRISYLSLGCILNYLKLGIVFDTFWCAR